MGHALLTAAYRHADASLLAPLSYLQLLWAGILGWLVFGHIADGISLLGMAIVAASGALIAIKTRAPPAVPPQDDPDILLPGESPSPRPALDATATAGS